MAFLPYLVKSALKTFVETWQLSCSATTITERMLVVAPTYGNSWIHFRLFQKVFCVLRCSRSITKIIICSLWFLTRFFDFQNLSVWLQKWFLALQNLSYWFLKWFFDFPNLSVWFLKWFFDFQNFFVWFLKLYFDFQNFSVWLRKWVFDFQDLSVWFAMTLLISKMCSLDFSNDTFSAVTFDTSGSKLG